MAIVHTYRCDICATVKRESNNWWVVDVSPSSGALIVFPFSSGRRDEPRVIHCCGVDCLARAVSRWAAEQTQDEKAPPQEAA